MTQETGSIDIQAELQTEIFTELTVNQHVDQFLAGEKDKLFITGMMGSGKSTIARLLGGRWDIDDIRSIDNIGKILSKADPNYDVKYQEMLNTLLSMEGRCIIEGVGLLKLPITWFADKAVMLPDVPVHIASMRASLRDNEDTASKRLRTIQNNKTKWEQKHAALKLFITGALYES